MTSGEKIEPLGIYLLVERSGDEIVRICFSAVPPDEPSDLARRIVDYLLGDAPCPDVKLSLSGTTDFKEGLFSCAGNSARPDDDLWRCRFAGRQARSCACCGSRYGLQSLCYPRALPSGGLA